jgi:ribonuclease BN (tRNA processing enzyme)
MSNFRHTAPVTPKLTVLGSSGAWPEPGRACSGYLLSHRGVRIVLDLGTGTAGRLFTLLGTDPPDAVVITHAHPDHAVDLHALFRSRLYTGHRTAPIPVFAPGRVAGLMATIDPDDAADLPSVFDFRPLPASPYEIGPFRLESTSLPHYVPNAGVRLVAPGLTVAYTGDTGPSAALAGLARDADLFIADSTGRPPLNLTARQAAAVAASGGARRLLLTHFWPGTDREDCRAAAAELYSGEILLADEGQEINLSR